MNYLFCILIGYGICAINPSFLLAKACGFDIRKRGSGNAGASNVLILFGKTIGISCALFTEMCKKAGVPTQPFANRSDSAGGSTLGSIADTLLPVNTVDIGMAQLAMHSSYETGGTADTAYLIRASEAFYKAKIVCEADGIYKLL